MNNHPKKNHQTQQALGGTTIQIPKRTELFANLKQAVKPKAKSRRRHYLYL